MKVVRFSSAESYEPEKDWKRVSLCNEKDISIEHFIKPPHHASPLHDHPSGEQVLGEGDAAYIPGNEPHVVTNLLDVPSIGLDIFIPGRSFDFWLKRKES
jgi:quercetin dioxygenase-like cupin family protein